MKTQESLNNDWQPVVDYYNSLSDEPLRLSFLNSLTLDQKNYLSEIINHPNHQITIGEDENEEILTSTKSKSNRSKAKSKLKSFSFHTFLRLRKKRANLKKDFTPLLIGLSSIFGIIAFIGSGLIFNFTNTVIFIRQIPVFGRVLGVKTPQDKESYYAQFDTWNKVNSTNYKANDDEDKDGLTNIDEFIWGSDQNNKDQNNNNILDGQDFLSGIDPMSLSLIEKTNADSFSKLNIMAPKIKVHNLLFSYSWDNYEDYLKQKQRVSDEIPENYKISAIDTNDTAQYEIDTTKPLTLTINKLNLIDQAVSYEDSATPVSSLLERNTISHLFESPLPGQKGVSMFIMPNLLQRDQSNIKSAASDLYSLGPSSQIDISGQTTSGQSITLNFEIIKNNLYSLDDISYSNQLTEAQIAISTSHPTDSQEKRIMIVAKLTMVVLN